MATLYQYQEPAIGDTRTPGAARAPLAADRSASAVRC